MGVSRSNVIEMVKWEFRMFILRSMTKYTLDHVLKYTSGNPIFHNLETGSRWLSGRVSDSGARGPGFETYRRRVVSLSKTLYSPKVLVNYPGSDGSVPT